MLNSRITGRFLQGKVFRNVSSLSDRITTPGIADCGLLRWIGHVLVVGMCAARNSKRKDNLKYLGSAGRIILK
jgi:hypothetical protein